MNGGFFMTTETKSKKKGLAKRIAAITMCAMLGVSCLSMTASAKNTNFSFNVGAGKSYYGYTATKDDYEQAAYINPKTITGKFILYAVNSNGTKVTYSRNVSSTGNKKYSYFTYSGKGAKRGVRAYNSGNSYAKISGKWCP